MLVLLVLLISTFVFPFIFGLLPHCLLAAFVVMIFGIREKCCCLHIVRHMTAHQIGAINFITIIINNNLAVYEICAQSRQVV